MEVEENVPLAMNLIFFDETAFLWEIEAKIV